MSVANLTDEELELCKSDAWYSTFPVIIKNGDVADDIGQINGDLCLKFLQTKDANDIGDGYRYDANRWYDLTKPADKKEYEAKAKDVLVFDTTDLESLKGSQARSAEVLKVLIGRQLEANKRSQEMDFDM
jgi:hypothetical protein